ncbi:MAG TPA: nicotinate (nicotinamide) nucleotide adenylyltransferase [Solirubrobacteraceae bacterium]|nr:nicotinate (nicotinamide) nucleotide adenylyltransferase [Solirubrobacteraceae bacterium]
MLGGTFNPPHRGHLELARHALRELALERVLLMPAHTAPNKAGGGDGALDPGPQRRLAMCRLACEGVPGVCACALEVERGGVSYTVDTLAALHASHPQAELTLIVGADVAGTLGSWREPQRLLELARVAVAARPGADVPALPPGARASRLEMAPIEVSSSLVRSRVARGQPVAGFVGERVAAYIAEHALYRVASGARA